MSRRLLVALVLPVVLVGCGGDPEPRVAPTPSSSPSVSPPPESPTPEPETAEEFIMRWFTVNDQMQNSGVTDAFLAMSAGCEPCAELAETVSSAYSAGGFVRSAGTSILRIRSIGSTSEQSEFAVTTEAGVTEIQRSSSEAVDSFPGGRAVYRVSLLRSGESWVMENYLLRSEEP